MTMPKIKYLALPLMALTILMSAFLMPVYASTGNGGGDDESGFIPIVSISGVVGEPVNETMIVNATWLDGEMLRIDVTDLTTGTVSSLAIRLSEFIANANNSPYILIQAVDSEGNLSGIIQISNPFYIPPDDTTDNSSGQNDSSEASGGNDNTNGNDSTNNDKDENETPQLGLTPDGTGTVIDNVVNQNEIEFFTVYTEEGNVFFLVVDRQRSTDNVYLLNAVTEADLMALAEQSGNPIEPPIGAIPTPPSVTEPEQPPNDNNQEQSQLPEPDTQPESSRGNSNIILIVIIVAVVGGVAYYFKIVRPKKNAVYDDDDIGEPDDDDDMDDGDDILDGDLDGGGDER